MLNDSIYLDLLEKDKQALKQVLINQGLGKEVIHQLYQGKLLTEYIAYQNLSREDKITVCIILIKTLSKREGAYIRQPDHSVWLSDMLHFKPQIGDHRCEREIFQFINITNLLHFQYLSTGNDMFDLAIKPLSSSCGAAIAGFCIFPLIESICRRRNPDLDNTGIAKRNIDCVIRGTKISKKKGKRLNNIQQVLLLLEDHLDSYLSESLGQLDQDMGFYSRILFARNSQLHGAFLGRADSIIYTLFLSLFYI